MAKIRGVVMKTEGRFMWVATADRGFRRYSLPSKEVKPGQEIMVSANPAKARFGVSMRAAVAACLLLFLISGLAITVFPINSAAAYLAVDINPSLELALDADNKVIKAVPLSEDAKVLLKDMKLERLDAYQALDQIIKKSEAEGYISADKENVVLLTITPVKEHYRQLDTSKAKQMVIDKMNEIGAAGSVGVQNSTEKERENARKEGISVNSYLMMQKASNKGLSKLQQSKKPSTKEIVDDLAKEGVGLDQLLVDVKKTTGNQEKGDKSNKNHDKNFQKENAGNGNHNQNDKINKGTQTEQQGKAKGKSLDEKAGRPEKTKQQLNEQENKKGKQTKNQENGFSAKIKKLIKKLRGAP